MGVEGGLCPLRIVRPSGAIKIIYIKFILSQPLRRTVVGRGLVSLTQKKPSVPVRGKS